MFVSSGPGSIIATYKEIISGAVRLMLRHDAGGPSARGTAIDAQLAIDNIALVPEPVFGPVACSALALASLGMVRRFRRRASAGSVEDATDS